jgi:predicted transcriptional regulator
LQSARSLESDSIIVLSDKADILSLRDKKKINRMNFNIDEIFEIAEQIERNGARFYRKPPKCKRIRA